MATRKRGIGTCYWLSRDRDPEHARQKALDALMTAIRVRPPMLELAKVDEDLEGLADHVTIEVSVA